ncbi:uncharacterized protein MELLADRAFT_103642 [Melampsora larici-populina 98AG31]|uniref:Uncharacterized protein n=1 Tax=Melampsora larici-populina (strain 98AG31 / pathotype 3-4-7) TaxID=747676 RepID=F4RC02_MELLP|nr:uncharacterized protein MELLADRAFT_103642 [Melampsora larici-populina 98AG31]EGG10246.1 hypothetical protein MELLADRAFT_103642 [Melampsora larici-populina 98AG31]
MTHSSILNFIDHLDNQAVKITEIGSNISPFISLSTYTTLIEMPSQQQNTRATRSGRPIDSQSNPIEIPPPSSSEAGQDLPTNNNLEGTDNPEDEERNNNALDGEALDEQLRDDVAIMMENYQEDGVEDPNISAQKTKIPQKPRPQTIRKNCPPTHQKIAILNHHPKNQHHLRVIQTHPNEKTSQKRSGLPCKSLLPTLQTYWNEAMLKLNEKVPLIVLNLSFIQQDQDERHKNQPSSSSKSSRNRGLNPPSEYTMSFGEWINGISLLRKYLKETYKFGILAKQLKSHIKHVKNIKESTECWMLFTHRAKGVPKPDASLYVENYKKRAKERASKTGELSVGNTNPYAKGGRYKNRNLITGSWNEKTLRSKRLTKKRFRGITPNSKKRRNNTSNNLLPSHQRRAARPPRTTFTHERTDQPQKQNDVRESEVRNQNFNHGANGAGGRGSNRQGRGGIVTRGRSRQQ